jgi:hypothetical protein
MTLKEKIVAILEERSFEVKDGGSKIQCVDAVDFEQIALDILDILGKDYSFETEE